MILLSVLLVLVSSQYGPPPINATLVSTNDQKPMLNLTFSDSLGLVPGFSIFTAQSEVTYRIFDNINNQTFVIQAIEPSNLIAEHVSVVFNQPMDINLILNDYTVSTLVQGGYSSDMTAPIALGALAFVLSTYGSGGIMMVQYIQILTSIKSINMFFRSFFSNLEDIIFFKWTPQIFDSISPDCFLNSCLIVICILSITSVLSIVVWKVLGNPVNPILIKIKNIFNFGILIVLWKVTIIPLGLGISRNFISLAKSPPVNSTLIVNQIVCVFFSVVYLGVMGWIVWFVGFAKVRDYYEKEVFDRFHKLYADVDTSKSYKRYYVLFQYFSLMALGIVLSNQYGIIFVIVLEDLHIFMIMITRPFRDYKYYQRMLFAVSSKFFSYLVEIACFMFVYLGVTLLENDGTFILDTLSLAFFGCALLNLLVISGLQAYERIRATVDNRNSGTHDTSKMVEMSRLSLKRNPDTLSKKVSLLQKRSRNPTQTPTQT